VLFFKAFDQYFAVAVSLFVIGSALMLIGSLGNGLRRWWEHQEQQSSSRA